jgi:hypothetical protein
MILPCILVTRHQHILYVRLLLDQPPYVHRNITVSKEAWTLIRFFISCGLFDDAGGIYTTAYRAQISSDPIQMFEKYSVAA